MIQRISGVIAAATAIRQFQKKDGTFSDQATLHIQQVTNDVYLQEVAVKVTGELAQFARMVGYNVEVDYVVRVFNFTKMGEQMIGNDIYARNIKVATPGVNDNDTAKAYDNDNNSHRSDSVSSSLTPNALTPNPLLALPAPAQPAGLLPAPQSDGDLPY